MKTLWFLAACLILAASGWSQSAGGPPLSAQVDSVYPQVKTLYMDLHEHPELSGHEVNTAAKVAAKLRALGYEVTEHVGRTGVVAVLRNAAGSTVMLRTELDALPVAEKTGLPYASTVRTKDNAGHDVAVMHACGHDIHMAALVGTAEIMAKTKDQWHGTLVLIGQPAEETAGGATGMIADGLFTRFPKPDVGVALHTTNTLPAGEVGFTPEYAASNADSVDITIYGKGGHGASPESTVDPIVIAARVVLTLQTIVSREIKPGDPAVITVGYIQGGTKNNIIPDEVHLGLTVRSYTPEVRKHLLAAIERVTKAEAQAADAPKAPLVQVVESTDALYNDPKLAERLSQALTQALGAGRVQREPPIMASEDYSYFVEAGVPSFYFWLGVADPEKFKEAQASGIHLPSNHSPFFAPDMEPSLKTAIESEVAVLRNLMARSNNAGAGATLEPSEIALPTFVGFDILRKDDFRTGREELAMKILILTTDQELALLRQRALETAGHEVVAIMTEKEALESPDNPVRVDVIVVCHRLPDATARKVIRLFHERHPESKVVYIVHLYGEWPEVEADRYVVGADGPDALLRVISEVGPQAAA